MNVMYFLISHLCRLLIGQTPLDVASDWLARVISLSQGGKIDIQTACRQPSLGAGTGEESLNHASVTSLLSSPTLCLPCHTLIGHLTYNSVEHRQLKRNTAFMLSFTLNNKDILIISSKIKIFCIVLEEKFK